VIDLNFSVELWKRQLDHLKLFFAYFSGCFCYSIQRTSFTTLAKITVLLIKDATKIYAF